MKSRRMNDLFDRIVSGYLFLNFICYAIFLIAPIVSLVMNTPLYNFQRYLGIIGVGLVLIDFMLNRYSFKTKDIWILVGILAISIGSSVYTLNYGVKDNLFDIAWFAIFIFLFYSYSLRVNRGTLEKQMKLVVHIIGCIWIIACILSISSFLFDSGYLEQANPYAGYGATRQGFLENRLFGIFMSVNLAAIVAGILSIFFVLSYIETKKIAYLLGTLIFYLYIILSGSRSTLLSLALALFVLSYYFAVKRFTHRPAFKKRVLAFLAASLCVGVFAGITWGVKESISFLPNWSVLSNNRDAYDELVQLYPNVVVEQDNAIVTTGNHLERPDVSVENVSNNRFDIWLDYVHLYQDISLFGISSGNYSYYIQEHNPDIYIVKYIRENHPGMYKDGRIYHPHNAFLMVYTAVGIVGLVLLLIFLMRSLFTVVHYLKTKPLSPLYMAAVLVIIFILGNGLFDSLLFFDNDILGCSFWVLSGFVLHAGHHQINQEIHYGSIKQK